MEDVILIITDGRPSKLSDTLKKAQLLKDKDILIVGAAIGPHRNQFMHQLKEIASGEDYVVKADFDKLDDIIGTLIAKSCVLPGK